jgi:hypothetical protein
MELNHKDLSAKENSVIAIREEVNRKSKGK